MQAIKESERLHMDREASHYVDELKSLAVLLTGRFACERGAAQLNATTSAFYCHISMLLLWLIGAC